MAELPTGAIPGEANCPKWTVVCKCSHHAQARPLTRLLVRSCRLDRRFGAFSVNRFGIDRRKMTVWVPKVAFYGGAGMPG
jgi:hypothetical protein